MEMLGRIWEKKQNELADLIRLELSLCPNWATGTKTPQRPDVLECRSIYLLVLKLRYSRRNYDAKSWMAIYVVATVYVMK